MTESGILKPADVQTMRDAGVHGFLVGEAFMRADRPRAWRWPQLFTYLGRPVGHGSCQRQSSRVSSR